MADDDDVKEVNENWSQGDENCEKDCAEFYEDDEYSGDCTCEFEME